MAFDYAAEVKALSEAGPRDGEVLVQLANLCRFETRGVAHRIAQRWDGPLEFYVLRWQLVLLILETQLMRVHTPGRVDWALVWAFAKRDPDWGNALEAVRNLALPEGWSREAHKFNAFETTPPHEVILVLAAFLIDTIPGALVHNVTPAIAR